MFLIPRSGPAPKPRVLKGNWYEEHLAEEHRLTEFANKRQDLLLRSHGGPVSQPPLKWTNLAAHFDTVNRPYTLSPRGNTASGQIRFGDLVQIQSERGLTLTFDLWTKTFVPSASLHTPTTTTSDTGVSELLVLASTFKNAPPAPVSRNVFQIVKCGGEEYEDEMVRHGVKFRLVVPQGRFDKQYALKSVPVTMSKMADDGNTEVVLTEQIDGFDVSWQVRDREHRLKSWQTPPVSPNTPILLNHCSTNAYLACHDDDVNNRKKFILDDGVQVLSTTDVDHRRYESYQWRLVPVDVSL